jgi:hypothetical protein
MPLYDEDRFSINKNSSIGREMLRKMSREQDNV